MDYFAMNTDALAAELERVRAEYDTFAARGLKLDMTRGKPAPAQLDLSAELLGMADCVDASGLDTRNYGAIEGTGEARAFFADMLGVRPDETVVCGSSSLNLMYNMVELGWRRGFGKGPWKDCAGVKFLCPAPGYDRHFRITEDFGFELISVPMTADGPDMDTVEALARDDAVKGMWCVPVYSNPDGYVYSDETVRRIGEMRASADFRVFWDNAYCAHHLTDEECACANLLEACRRAGNEDRALMFCSTSKITFAGAGVAAMGMSAANMKLAVKHMSVMTICGDKVNQLRHVRYLKKEGLARHMKKHAALMKPKFDRVISGLRAQLAPCGPIARWTEPKGGYFVSLYLREGCAARVVQLCAGGGVALTGAGAAFPYGTDPADSHLRIAPTYPSVEEVEQAVRLLCIAVKLAVLEKMAAA